jgi:hypothetical protein
MLSHMMHDELNRFQHRHNGNCHFGAGVFATMSRAIPALHSFVVLANNSFVLSGFERVYRSFFHILKRLQPVLMSVKKKH